jgi:hypothetical protein
MAELDAAGVDWRFADPAADSVAVLQCTKLSASPLAHSLIDQLSNKSLTATDAQKIFRAFSGVGQVALSIRDEKVVILVTGRGAESILPAPEAGWKSVSIPGGNTVLIGHSEAVDQATQRLLTYSQLGELSLLALDRKPDNDFWAAGSAKLAGPKAVAAGVKRFTLTASMKDKLATETNFEFDAVPDAREIRGWLGALDENAIDGKVVHVKASLDSDAAKQQFPTSLAGQRLEAFMSPARYLPVRDTANTVHTKPVIYGLEDGPREVKYVPSAPEPPAQKPSPDPRSSSSSASASREPWKWVIQAEAAPAGAEVKYKSFYYEAATDRSVEKPLTLATGASIVGVFPEDCTFSVRNEAGNSFTFRNEAEAKAKGLSAGTWSVFPLKCGGIAVFVK